MLYFPEYQDKEEIKKKRGRNRNNFRKSNTKNFSNIHQFGNLEKEFIEDKSNQKFFKPSLKVIIYMVLLKMSVVGIQLMR